MPNTTKPTRPPVSTVDADPAATASDTTTATAVADATTTARTTTTDTVAPRESIEHRVWGALRAHPGATAAELALEARAGRSTVSKVLAGWAAEGSATSAPGDNPRAARRWTAAPTHLPPITTEADANPPRHDTAAPSHTPADAPEHATQRAPSTTAPITRADTPTPNERSGSEPRGDAHDTNSSRPQRTLGGNRSGSARLGAGELRGMVKDYLREHTGEHSPVTIGKALKRSAGAIANALERLVEDSWAERASGRPKRYRAAYPVETRDAGGDAQIRCD